MAINENIRTIFDMGFSFRRKMERTSAPNASRRMIGEFYAEDGRLTSAVLAMTAKHVSRAQERIYSIMAYLSPDSEYLAVHSISPLLAASRVILTSGPSFSFLWTAAPRHSTSAKSYPAGWVK